MRRGDVYLATVAPRAGSEIQGDRPVLVVSHDSFNRTLTWPSITVVPLTTSSAHARRSPTVVHLPNGAGGLRGEGYTVCHPLTTLNRTKLTRRLGALCPELLDAVEVGINTALDLP